MERETLFHINNVSSLALGGRRKMFGNHNRSGVICTPVQIGDILVEIDGQSFSELGLCAENITADNMDCAPDVLCFSVDVAAEDGECLKSDARIICEAYAGGRKLSTQKRMLTAKDFSGREKLEIDFKKWGICDAADRITVYCEHI